MKVEGLIELYSEEKIAEAKEKFKKATIQNDLIFYHVMKNIRFYERSLHIVLKKGLHIADSIPQSTIVTSLSPKNVRYE